MELKKMNIIFEVHTNFNTQPRYIELPWVKVRDTNIVISYQVSATFSLVHIFHALQNDTNIVDQHHRIDSLDDNIMHQFLLTEKRECLQKGCCQIHKQLLDSCRISRARLIQFRLSGHWVWYQPVKFTYHSAVANKILIK